MRYKPCPYSMGAVIIVQSELQHRADGLGPRMLYSGDAAVLLDALTEHFGDALKLPTPDGVLAKWDLPDTREAHWVCAGWLNVWTTHDHSRLMRNAPDRYQASRTIMETVALILDGRDNFSFGEMVNRLPPGILQYLPGYVVALANLLSGRYVPDYRSVGTIMPQFQVYQLIDKMLPPDTGH